LQHTDAPPAGESMVLPRPLRRVVRIAVGLCTGRITIPARVGRTAFAVYCLAVVTQGVVAGGHSNAVFQGLTSIAGFAIENVKVSGNSETSEIDILQLLGLDGATSLVALDIDGARRRLAEMPWVETAEVRKIYPATVEIALTERKAYGIWQHGTELSLIEKNGSVIAPLRDAKFSGLPLFVGRDAERAAAAVEEEFARWPDLLKRVKAFVRVAGRRWDIHLDNGVVVRLPQDDIDQALALLAKMDAEQRLLERDIAAVDLRLKDRTTVRLTPEALVRRQAAIDARDKALKKAGQST
jgi:cell division protein FtsQ